MHFRSNGLRTAKALKSRSVQTTASAGFSIFSAPVPSRGHFLTPFPFPPTITENQAPGKSPRAALFRTGKRQICLQVRAFTTQPSGGTVILNMKLSLSQRRFNGHIKFIAQRVNSAPCPLMTEVVLGFAHGQDGILACPGRGISVLGVRCLNRDILAPLGRGR